mmetsp:Transcript_13812/g.18886  ORF Transcript_13812/g.18886 Transcript_13812/m.18886 type:complete len:205 (-) Transcript_13812:157-771(-)
MFSTGNSSSSSSIFGSESSNSSSLLPVFQEEPACAKCCPKLTYEQRLYGYGISTAIGFVLSLIGTLVLFGGTSTSNIALFAVLYVLGNVIALLATGFLLGPRSQCTKMWAPTRRFTTAFYLIMIIVVFIVAILKQNVFIVLFLLFIEILAATWYSISYIPFGRKMVCTFFRSTGLCMPCFYVSDSIAEARKGGSSGGSSVFGGK